MFIVGNFRTLIVRAATLGRDTFIKSRIRNIDGLRGIAVLSVIFFHASFTGVGGGFIGVDIFFVISGYVITNSILTNRMGGEFTLIRFYESRIRRLFPSLAVVLLVTFGLCFFLTPSDFSDFSKTLMGTITGTSNIFFWKTTYYFTKPGDYIPLLHTWSLSLEEQFYIIFPFLFLCVLKLKSSLRLLLVGFIILCSFTLSIYLLNVGPLFSFYMLPTRAWELLLGVAVADWSFHKRLVPIDSKYSRALTLVALTTIVGSFSLFNSTISSPNIYTIIPCLATLYLISLGSKNLLSNIFLGNRLIVYIGSISYPLYLWHQPLFSFVRLRSSIVPAPKSFLLLIILSIILAHLSHYFVDRRFRSDQIKLIDRQRLLLVWLISSIFIFLLGASALVTNGFENRLTQSEKSITHVKTLGNPNADIQWRKCFLAGDQTYKDFATSCFSTAKPGTQTFVLGDSHAAMIASTLQKQSQMITALSMSACPPILNIVSPVRKSCSDTMDYYLAKIEKLQPAQVILIANWYAYGVHFLNQSDNNYDLLEKSVVKIKKISPHSRIFLVGSTPEWFPDLPTNLIRMHNTGGKLSIFTPSWSDLDKYNQLVRGVANRQEVSFVNLLDYFCRPNYCNAFAKNSNGVMTPIIFDDGHFSPAGVDEVLKSQPFKIIMKTLK